MTPKIKIALFFILGIGIASTSRILNGSYAFFDSLWPALVGVCVAAYPLIDLNALLHAAKIERNEYPIHWQSWLLRAAIGLVLCSIFHAYYFHLEKVVTLALFGAGWFGIVFNFKLNHYRNLPLLYIGNPDKKRDGAIEKIFRKFGRLGGAVLLLMEVAWMFLCGWIYLNRP